MPDVLHVLPVMPLPRVNHSYSTLVLAVAVPVIGRLEGALTVLQYP
jgi:hypothetical protein